MCADERPSLRIRVDAIPHLSRESLARVPHDTWSSSEDTGSHPKGGSADSSDLRRIVEDAMRIVKVVPAQDSDASRRGPRARGIFGLCYCCRTQDIVEELTVMTPEAFLRNAPAIDGNATGRNLRSMKGVASQTREASSWIADREFDDDDPENLDTADYVAAVLSAQNAVPKLPQLSAWALRASHERQHPEINVGMYDDTSSAYTTHLAESDNTTPPTGRGLQLRHGRTPNVPSAVPEVLSSALMRTMTSFESDYVPVRSYINLQTRRYDRNNLSQQRPRRDTAEDFAFDVSSISVDLSPTECASIVGSCSSRREPSVANTAESTIPPPIVSFHEPPTSSIHEFASSEHSTYSSSTTSSASSSWREDVAQAPNPPSSDFSMADEIPDEGPRIQFHGSPSPETYRARSTQHWRDSDSDDSTTFSSGVDSIPSEGATALTSSSVRRARARKYLSKTESGSQAEQKPPHESFPQQERETMTMAEFRQRLRRPTLSSLALLKNKISVGGLILQPNGQMKAADGFLLTVEKIGVLSVVKKGFVKKFPLDALMVVDASPQCVARVKESLESKQHTTQEMVKVSWTGVQLEVFEESELAVALYFSNRSLPFILIFKRGHDKRLFLRRLAFACTTGPNESQIDIFTGAVSAFTSAV